MSKGCKCCPSRPAWSTLFKLCMLGWDEMSESVFARAVDLAGLFARLTAGAACDVALVTDPKALWWISGMESVLS